MAKPRIGVTASKMRQMREDGMSNHDIAKALDISYASVLRYIGKQEQKMERLEAFKDAPTKVIVPNDVPVVEPYKPKAKSELYRITDTIDALIDYDEKMIHVRTETASPSIMGYESHAVSIPFSEVVDVLQFFAWANREKIQEEE